MRHDPEEVVLTRHLDVRGVGDRVGEVAPARGGDHPITDDVHHQRGGLDRVQRLRLVEAQHALDLAGDVGRARGLALQRPTQRTKDALSLWLGIIQSTMYSGRRPHVSTSSSNRLMRW